MPGVHDRVAVVTGAANGLGREIALLFAREGARVALGDVDAAGLDKTAAAITAAGGPQTAAQVTPAIKAAQQTVLASSFGGAKTRYQVKKNSY